MQTKFIYPNIEKGKRVLVVGDIHGHLTHLKGALENAGYSEDDALIVIGDIIDKGPESLNTLRYVIELAKTREVYVLMGNVDIRVVNLLYTYSENNFEHLCRWIHANREWKGTSLFDEMAKEIGVAFDTVEDIRNARDAILSAFREEIEFIVSRPTVLECGNYVFVHGGLRYANIKENENIDAWSLLKYDRFMDTELVFDKYVVVGHWPVTIYNEKIAQANPVINREKRIISIDGGCGLKTDGQLNVLIIPSLYDEDAKDVHSAYYDGFPTITALDVQQESTDSINIHWGDTYIRLIEQGEEFSLVEHKSSGRKMMMYNKYIDEFTEDTTCNDYTDRLLGVSAGDTLSLIHETGRGCIVKKNGETGWYCGKIEK